ncbi:uncharacterized protein JN550_010794 [Neoarthrinium moseri]|uniref:uncharacterized protein n=1 Tax=Neoarthrinium moseri TaxID=1658444 RepID=UPI001FDBE39D|nr:uncharacterized protein JN550_010794 [Neoarthrinium moseri]KAI1861414.1 hypothetical protein JN550_010794 [Neoarthrinium moseri]
MPAAVKRQRPAVRSKAAPPKQQAASSISTFARVSKSVGDSQTKKELASTPRKEASVTAITPASRKRKALAPTVEDADDSSADESPVPASLPRAAPREVLAAKRARGRQAKKSRPAPASLKRGRSPSLSDSDQSTINTDKLFKRLRLESSPSRASSPLTADTSVANTDVDSDIELSTSPTLPSEVLNLVDLHTAFLKALTLHYAHNGSHIPADLRELCPNVARSWGKKAVSEADIRICLGVLNMKLSSATFSLSDYGRGKICIEVDRAQVSGPLNEKQLNGTFYSNMESLWTHFLARGRRDVGEFIKSLPRASIAVCESIAKASPVLAKGQKRLEELKQGITAKKLEKENKTAPAAAAAASPAGSPLTNPDGSKMSLLDRIRFKQMQKAAMPAGLSAAQMERRAALQRADEVAALIGMLSRASSSGMGRISFPMATMLEKLKDSFRMGISKDEGATCVRLIAKEVAPEWVMVVTIGGRENVVVETDRQLSKAEVSRRVQAAIARN